MILRMTVYRDNKVGIIHFRGAAAHVSSGSRSVGRYLQGILDRLNREIRVLRFNFYKWVKFANSFKWRLMENGVEKAVAGQVTHSLLLRLYANPARIGSRRHRNAGKSDGRTRP